MACGCSACVNNQSCKLYRRFYAGNSHRPKIVIATATGLPALAKALGTCKKINGKNAAPTRAVGVPLGNPRGNDTGGRTMQLSASRRNGSSIDFRGSRGAGEVGAPYGPVIDNVSVVEAIAIRRLVALLSWPRARRSGLRAAQTRCLTPTLRSYINGGLSRPPFSFVECRPTVRSSLSEGRSPVPFWRAPPVMGLANLKQGALVRGVFAGFQRPAGFSPITPRIPLRMIPRRGIAMPGFVRHPRGAIKLSMRLRGRSCHWMLNAQSFGKNCRWA